MPTYAIVQALASIMKLLEGLIMLWCLLSWFPNIRWSDQPFRALDMMVSPMVAPFRRIIPPGLLGGIDITPMIPVILIEVIGNTVIGILAR
ncbi:MAG TPA: YggT family protein [Chroococcales cyanobacterium]